MRKILVGISAAFILVSGSVVTTGVAQAGEMSLAQTMAATIQVQVASANGSGCPSGVAGLSASYNNGIELNFPELASVRGNAGVGPDLQENCQLSLRITTPNRVSWAVSAIKTNAHASLTKGASARVEQSAYVQGMSTTNNLGYEIAGPINSDVNLDGAMVPGSMQFSPCDAERNLNVNTRVILTNSGVGGDSMNKIAITRGMKIALALKNC